MSTDSKTTKRQVKKDEQTPSGSNEVFNEEKKEQVQDDVSDEQEAENRSNFMQVIHAQLIKWAPALNMTILLLISIVAVLVRVYSVIRYESIIHEFDPWFNYRTTQYLVTNKDGIYGLWNWFDSESWYPLGRSVGGTLYPGLMATAGAIYWTLHKLCLPVDIRNVCVFLAPIFAAFTSIATYLLTRQVTKRADAGLFSALFIAIVPTYMSRSVAGSYDNEGVAIFALVFTFYLFLKAANTGSIIWSSYSALSLFFMVASWGGYAFIINIIPIFVVFLMITDRYSTKLYVAYNVFYILGTILALQIPFVGFQAIHSSEHMASHGVFILLQVYKFVNFLKGHIHKKGVKILTRLFIIGVALFLLLAFIFMLVTGKTKWSGRSLTLLDPTYAKKYIPIIASVSEHQATTWSSFFFDLHFLTIFGPIGLYYCFKKPNYGKIFMAIYLVLSVYFASVMVRLLLVLGPALSIVGGIGVSWTVNLFTKSLRNFVFGAKKQEKKTKFHVSPTVSLVGLLLIGYLISIYIMHCNYTGAEAYSSPSIILSNRDRNGNRHIVDDFREAYFWLRQNTKSDEKILSWWDYGYQITGMSNRTVMVDNNTWNNTHIATVAMALASSESDAYEVCDKLDVDYILMIFGGYSYFSGDDINKFLWMVRIAGGVYPHVKEEDFYSKNNQYRIDSQASETMLNSLMFRLSFYRFDEIQTAYQKPKGWDNVRNQEVGLKKFKLEYFEEAFTSENWIVRIYRRKPRKNREGIVFLSKNLNNFPAPEQDSEYRKKYDVFDGIKFNKLILKKRRNVASR
ncbi:hypothetical protein ABPG74_018333 [Tetrahymena malaccensis]